MSALQVGGSCTLLLAAAGAALVRGLRRAPSSVRSARRAMRGEGATVSNGLRTVAEGAPAAWVDRHHAEDLRILGITAADLATRAVTAAVLVSAIIGLGAAALAAIGVVPGFAVGLAPVAGGLAGWSVVRSAVTDASVRRKEARRAANDFVQLVAIGLTTDQSVEESIRFALDVGAGAGFDALRHEVTTAPMRGVAVWEAIDTVGRRFGIRELTELASSIERQGLQGVAIGDTVAAMSAAMRAAALDELERDADRANANLSGPTIGFVVATIVFLAYPLAQRISDAFGG